MKYSNLRVITCLYNIIKFMVSEWGVFGCQNSKMFGNRKSSNSKMFGNRKRFYLSLKKNLMKVQSGTDLLAA